MGHRIRFTINEMSGALGDLATFLPLAVGLIVVNGVNPTALFLSAGLLYVAAGLYYRLPVPVQPLKATSAIAIAVAAPPGAVSATALLMGILFAGAALLDLKRFYAMVFTRPVVRGIQLGLGILLVKGGAKLLAGGGVRGAASGSLSPAATVAVAAAVAALILLSRENRRYPAALAVLFLGGLCGYFLLPHASLPELSPGWVPPAWGLPSAVDLHLALVALLLPQVPLTVANSLVATSDAARRYYGDGAARVTPRALSATLGLANLFSGLAGGMPVCHGSGGVTAHYRFGARTGVANLFIGSLFILLALLSGKAIPALAALLPPAVLGILLVYVGVEHARLVRDILEDRRELVVTAAVGATTLFTGNLAVAFVAGASIDLLGRNVPVFRRRSSGEGAAGAGPSE